jgi:SpoVK/Ycf46/Vps4 family AAA+-type ATPase
LTSSPWILDSVFAQYGALRSGIEIKTESERKRLDNIKICLDQAPDEKPIEETSVDEIQILEEPPKKNPRIST